MGGAAAGSGCRISGSGGAGQPACSQHMRCRFSSALPLKPAPTATGAAGTHSTRMTCWGFDGSSMKAEMSVATPPSADTSSYGSAHTRGCAQGEWEAAQVGRCTHKEVSKGVVHRWGGRRHAQVGRQHSVPHTNFQQMMASWHGAAPGPVHEATDGAPQQRCPACSHALCHETCSAVSCATTALDLDSNRQESSPEE